MIVSNYNNTIIRLTERRKAVTRISNRFYENAMKPENTRPVSPEAGMPPLLHASAQRQLGASAWNSFPGARPKPRPKLAKSGQERPCLTTGNSRRFARFASEPHHRGKILNRSGFVRFCSLPRRSSLAVLPAPTVGLDADLRHPDNMNLLPSKDLPVEQLSFAWAAGRSIPPGVRAGSVPDVPVAGTGQRSVLSGFVRFCAVSLRCLRCLLSFPVCPFCGPKISNLGNRR